MPNLNEFSTYLTTTDVLPTPAGQKEAKSMCQWRLDIDVRKRKRKSTCAAEYDDFSFERGGTVHADELFTLAKIRGDSPHRALLISAFLDQILKKEEEVEVAGRA